MSTWLSLARTAPGCMIEILTHRTSGRCLIAGHTLTWQSDTVACTHCRHCFPAATDAILSGLDTIEGQAMVAKELRT